MLKNIKFTIILIILSICTFGCPWDESPSVDIVTPKVGKTDVPLNAVIKVVVTTKSKLKKSSLNAEKFSLAKMVEKEKEEEDSEESKSSTTNQSSGLQTQSTTQKETKAVKTILKFESEPVGVVNEGGNETNVKTTVYIIPVPDKSINPPLEPLQEYVVTVGSLKDVDDNTYLGSTRSFKTEDEGFEFETTANIESTIEPTTTNLFSNPIEGNQEFIIKFTGPVNPFLLNEYSKLVSTHDRNIDSIDDFTDQEKEEVKNIPKQPHPQQTEEFALKQFDYYTKKIEQAQKRFDTEIPKEREKIQKELEDAYSETGITEEQREAKVAAKESALLALDEEEARLIEETIPMYEQKINNLYAGVYGNQIEEETDKEKKEPSPGGYERKTTDTHKFTLSFLENFAIDPENQKSEYITAKYDTVIVTTDFDYLSLYKLTLSSTDQGGKAIQTFDKISVLPTADYVRPEGISGTEINYFDTQTQASTSSE